MSGIEVDHFHSAVADTLKCSFCRHTENMIKKLETAGLGFYVKQDMTADRLGKINQCN